MNFLTTIETVYIKANKTIDITLVSCFKELNIKQTVLYIYNYEGIHYRVFKKLNDFLNLLHGDSDNCLCEFDNETEMENYLIEEYTIE